MRTEESQKQKPGGTPGGGGVPWAERVIDLAMLCGWLLFVAFCFGAMAGMFVVAMLIMLVVFV
jgi:hypothetical protein